MYIFTYEFDYRSRVQYAVVEFLEDHAVEVVPTNWFNENEKKCYWPSNFKSKKLKLAVLSAAAPTKEFVPLSIRVLYRGKCISLSSVYFVL